MSDTTDRSDLETIVIVVAVAVTMIVVKNLIVRAAFKAYAKSKQK